MTQAHVFPYKSKLEVEMNTVIAYCDSALTKDGYEPTLGNFVLGSMEHYINFNKPGLKDQCIFIMNRGGLRNNLPKGEITKQNIFELMPFENELVILTIKGEKLKDCINSICTIGKILSFNMNFTIRNKVPEGIKILGNDIDGNKDYFIVVSDYLAGGGDNCTFFANPVKYEACNIKLRDVIMNYCEYLTKNKTHLKPFTDGRIKLSK